MDRDDRYERKAPGNVVCFGANGVSDEVKTTRYPIEWKACCRDIFIAYRNLLADRFGEKRRGWQRVRNLVMRDFDHQADGQEDKRLLRQHLENWVKPEKSPDALGDGAFKFLDWYVRRELCDPSSDLAFAKDVVLAFRDGQQFDRMRSLYVGPGQYVRETVLNACEQYAGRMFVTADPLQSQKVSTAIYFKKRRPHKFSVVAMYHRSGEESRSTFIRESYKYHGHMVPMCLRGANMAAGHVYGVMQLFDRSLLSLKEFAFHSTSHCYLKGSSLQMSTGSVDDCANPFRLRNQSDAPSDDIRHELAVAQNRFSVAVGGVETKFDEINIDEYDSDYLENLYDEYLI